MKFSAHKNVFSMYFSCHNEYEAFINNVWTSKLHDSSTIFNFSAQFHVHIFLQPDHNSLSPVRPVCPVSPVRSFVRSVHSLNARLRCTETCGFFAKLINVASHETLSLIKGKKKHHFKWKNMKYFLVCWRAINSLAREEFTLSLSPLVSFFLSPFFSFHIKRL